MEKSPIDTSISSPEKDLSTKESKTKSKKKAETFGALAIKREQPASAEQKPSFFGRDSKKESNIFSGLGKTAEHAEPSVQSAVDKVEKSELPADISTLNKEEERFAVRAASEELRTQPRPEAADEADEAEELAAAEFHEAIEQTDGDLDAVDQVMAERGYVLDDTLSEPAPDEAELEESTETVEELSDVENDEEAIGEADEDDITVPPVTPPPVGGSHPPAPPTRPPTPPTPPVGGSSAAPRTATAGAFMRSPAIVPTSPNVIVDRGNTTGAFLLGGVVGYFIGRRRGRIKTEKKLKPIQKKLEKQVEALQLKVADREQKIRQAARRRVLEQQPTVTAERLGKALNQADLAEKSVTVAQSVAEKPPKLAVEAAPKPAAEQVIPTREVTVLAKPEAPTHLGQMIITAEAAILAAPLAEVTAAHTKEQIREVKLTPEAKKSIEKKMLTMNRTELMQVAETVVIDGSSLRQIYDTKLVSERGLRRLMEVHLRGGDVKKQLRKEIIEREIDFERDPALRDKGTAGFMAGGAAENPLQQLLERVNDGSDQKQEEVEFLKAQARHQEQELMRAQQKRRMLDMSLGTIIAVLVVFVAILLMERM